jgi:hypothetical protein
LLIAASTCRSRDRRRQMTIKAIQSLTRCVMLMIFVLEPVAIVSLVLSRTNAAVSN